jgi:hypothetical protein
VKDWLLILRNLILALLVIFIGGLLPPLHWLEEWIAPRRSGLVWLTAGMAGAGWIIFMGAVIDRIRTGGRPLERREIEASVKSVKDGIEIPYASRKSRYWVPAKAAGAGFSDQVSIGEFKAAWVHGLWRIDPRWRGMFLMALGALFMLVGGFSLIIVLCPPGLKFLAGCALAYAFFNIIRAFTRNSPPS